MTLNISTNPKIPVSWDTINSAQAYSQKPLAASYVRDGYYVDQPKKTSTLKKVLYVAGGLAVIAGGLALARTKIDAIKNVNLSEGAAEGFKGKVKFYIAKAGQMVIDGVKKLKFWGKAQEAAAEVTEEAASA